MITPTTPPPRLEGIESLRAYAAVAVVLFHVVWVGNAQPPKSLEFLKWTGGFGVQFFFVVSAFSLAYGYWGRLGSDSELRAYFVRRFARIAPLYYAVFVFQLAILYAAGAVPSLVDIGLCIAFAFNFVPRLVDGIVPASWSIGVEMVFYILFPFVLVLCRRWWAAVLVLAGSVVVAFRYAADLAPAGPSLASFASHGVVAQLPFFFWGVAGYHAYAALRDTRLVHGYARRLSWTIVVGSLLLLVLVIRNSELYMFFWSRGLRTVWDASWGLPFAALCIGVAIHPTRLISNAMTRYLGKVSYSLYLLHPAVVTYAGRGGAYEAVYNNLPGQELLAFAICAVSSIAVVAALSALTFRVIEAPGMRWGKRAAERERSIGD